MSGPAAELSEFRLERKDNGLVHVVFDAPGRTMNVFSEAAIVEIGLHRAMARRGRRARRGDPLGQGERVLRRRQSAGDLGRLRHDHGDARAAPLQDRLRSFLPPQPRAARPGDLRQAGRRRDRGLGARRRRRTRARLALPRADRRQTRGDRSSRVPGGPASGRRRNSAAAAAGRRRSRNADPSGRRPAFRRSRDQGGSCPRRGQTRRGDRGGGRLAALGAFAGRSPGTATIGFLQRPPM